MCRQPSVNDGLYGQEIIEIQVDYTGREEEEETCLKDVCKEEKRGENDNKQQRVCLTRITI